MPKLSIENSALTFTNSEDSELNLFGLTTNSTHLTLPTGTTEQRPNSAQTGMIRFNTDTNKVEGYDGTSWVDLT